MEETGLQGSLERKWLVFDFISISERLSEFNLEINSK